MARDGRGAGDGWRRWLGDLEDALADALELPRDAVRNLPRITLMGPLELVVENHRGVLLFDAARMLVAVPGGRLEVTGDRLAIGRIDREELRVQGRIEQVRFLPGPAGEAP
ncbi:MAG TPA: YabP/YqfC family sporulation protein [Thermaerobacter sp.]